MLRDQTPRTRIIFSGILLVAAAVSPNLGSAQERETPAPRFTEDGRLAFPTDYREWVYVTTGLGMTYGPSRVAEGETPQFDNVFVTPTAYREFQRTGTWPDGTMFVLEVRASEANKSINVGGYTQSYVKGVEASVKDRSRFPDGGWAYFHFEDPADQTQAIAPLPETATCYACHSENTAVDNTFVQFYPTLFEVAQRLRTLSSEFDPVGDGTGH